MLVEFLAAGRITPEQFALFERELFGHFIEAPGRTFDASCLPIQPMLARPLVQLEDLKKHLKGFAETALCEFKYDGERLLVAFAEQVHWSGSQAAFYSRSGENSTFKYADVLPALSQVLGGQPACVLDGEIVPATPPAEPFFRSATS